MKKIAIRVDGGFKIGLGHIYRSLALAEMTAPIYQSIFIISEPSKQIRTLISNSKFELIAIQKLPFQDEIKLLSNELLPSLKPDAIVLDGYHFKEEYQKQLVGKGFKLVSIDGIYNCHFYSQAILNYNMYATKESYSKEAYTQTYLGAKYCLLRNDFINAIAQRGKVKRGNELLIMFGGSDQFNLTLQTLKMLKKCWKQESSCTINVLVGGSYQFKEALTGYAERTTNIKVNYNLNSSEMVQLFQKTSLAITAASYSLYEMFCIGIPVITGHYVDNQKMNASAVAEKKLGVSLGNLLELNESKLLDALQTASEQQDFFIDNQFKTINNSLIDDVLAIFNQIT